MGNRQIRFCVFAIMLSYVYMRIVMVQIGNPFGLLNAYCKLFIFTNTTHICYNRVRFGASTISTTLVCAVQTRTSVNIDLFSRFVHTMAFRRVMSPALSAETFKQVLTDHLPADLVDQIPTAKGKVLKLAFDKKSRPTVDFEMLFFE